MRSAKIVAGFLGLASVCGMGQRVCAQAPAAGKNKRIVIAASTVLDGKGKVLRDARIVVEGEKIAAGETKNDKGGGAGDYDLRGRAVLAGGSERHAHNKWEFGKDGEK